MATYSGGWSISGTTAIYTIKDETNNTVAQVTVKGLKDGVTSSALTFAFTDETDFTKGGTIDLKAAALGTTNVSVTALSTEGNDITSKYSFTLATDVDQETSDGVKVDAAWATNSGTATYTEAYYAKLFYTASGQTVTYRAADTTPSAAATITGLNTNVAADDFASPISGTKITLTDAMLPEGATTSTVTLTSDKYSLKLADGVATAPADSYAWTAPSNRTANYQKSVSKYYTLSGKTVTYTPAVPATTVATLTNLASAITAENLANVVSGKTITLTEDMLSTTEGSKTALSGSGGYTLALADEVPKENTTDPEDLWTVAKSSDTYTATLANYKPAYFKVASNAVTYTPQAKTATGDLAVITGLNGTSESVISTPQKAAPIGITMPAEGSKVITLDDDLLSATAGSVISVTGNYTLALEATTTHAWAAVEGNPTWFIEDGTGGFANTKTVSYKCKNKAGYKADNDDNVKTLTYTPSESNLIFAIKGLNNPAGGSESAEGFNLIGHIALGDTEDTKKVIYLEQDVLYTDSTAKTANLSSTPVTTLELGTGVEGYTLAYKPSDTNYSYANKGQNIKGKDVDDLNLWTATAKTTDGTPSTTTYGKATLQAYKPEHYEVDADGTTITYVPLALDSEVTNSLAVIDGLDISTAITMDLTAATPTYPATSIDGIATTFDAGALTKVTLDQRVLPKDTENVVTLEEGDCELAIDTTTATDANKVPVYEISPTTLFWSIENVEASGEVVSKKAVYNRAVTAGYTVGKASDSDAKNNKITYTDDTPIEVATIEGLTKETIEGTAITAGSPGYKTGETRYSAITGIAVTAPTSAATGTFELANSILPGTTTITTTITTNEDAYTGDDAYKSNFDLALNNDAKAAVSNVTVTNDSGTGKVKGDITGYSLYKDGNVHEIRSVASPSGTPATLASISQLKTSNATGTLSFTNNLIVIDRGQLDEDDVALTSDNSLEDDVKAIVDTYKLKLTDAATTKAYKADTQDLELDENGKATITGTLDYYELDTSEDGESRKILYKEDEETELATIEGLNADATTPIDKTAIDDAGKISIRKDDVAGKDITLTNKLADTKKYTLALDDTDFTGGTDDDDYRKEAEDKDIWVADATKGTAAYKKVTLDYYDLAADGSKIEYKAQEDVSTYLTLSGLNKDEDVLVVKNNAIDGITLDTGNKLATLKSKVLNNETVEITGTGYKLAYEASAVGDPPNKATYTYDLKYSNGTATFKRGNEAYYKLDTDKTKLVYNAAKEPDTTLVTVKGLSDEVDPFPAGTTGLTTTGKWVLGYSDTSTADVITPAVTFLAPADEDEGKDFVEKVILNDKTALNEESVEITNGDGFKYKLYNEITDIAPKTTTLWEKESSNYAYYAGNSSGYNLESNGLKFTFSKAAKGTGNTALATITGLNSNVKVNNDGKIVNSSGAEVVTVDDTSGSKKITLKTDALGTTDVKFVGDSGSYKFVLDEYVPAGTSTETWSESKGTVTYTRATTANYELNTKPGGADAAKYLDTGKYVRYTAPVTYNVTISGLDSTKVDAAFTKDASGNITGIKRSAEGGIDVTPAEAKTDEVKDGDKIAFDAEAAVNGKVTVNEGLFNTTKRGDIKVASSNRRSFEYTVGATALATGSNIALSADPTWEITNGKATYVRKVDAEKYYADGSDKITYYKTKKVLSTLATINGLDKTLTTFNPAVSATATNYDANGKDISEANGNKDATVKGSYYTITMTKDLLTGITKDKAKVTLTSGKDGNNTKEYRFVLDDNGEDKVAVPEVQDPVWVTKKGTATLQYETTPGFTLSDAKKTTHDDVITYSADKWTPIVTLTGLKNLTNAKEKEYEVGGTSATDTPNAPATISEFASKGISASAIVVVDDNGNPVLDDNNAQKKVSTIMLSASTTPEDSLLTTSNIKLKNNTKVKDWTDAVETEGTWADKLNDLGYQNAQFVLKVNADLNPEGYTEKWSYKSGTATLTNGKKAGYELKSGSTDTVNYVKEKVETTIATISGLPKATGTNAKDYYAVGTDGKLYMTDTTTGAITGKEAVQDPTVTYKDQAKKDSVTNATITFTKDGLEPLTSGTIKVKEKTVALAVAADAAPVYAEGNDGAWSIEKGKATLNRTVAVVGWKTTDGLSISYVDEKDKKGNANVETLATITGLNKDLTLKTVATYNAAGNVTYAIYGADDAVVLAATTKGAYQTEFNKYIEFNPNPGNGNTGTATLHDDVLSTSKVSIKSTNKNDNYDLALASDVNDKSNEKENYWTVNGNKATFAYGKLAYYTEVADSKLVGSDGKTKLITSINYTKAPKADVTYFTLSGIKKGAQAGTSATDQKDFYISSGLNADGEVTGDMTVTLNSTAFDTTKQDSTKVTLSVPKDVKKDTNLSFGTGITQAVTTDSWNSGSGKATLERKVTTNGYMMSSDTKSVTYGNKDKTKATALATLNGIGSTAPAVPGADKVITIATAQTGGKKITLKDNVNGGYTLNNTAAAPVVTPADARNDSLKAASAWSTPKSGKVNLLGSVTTAGYTQSDNYNINYTAAASSGAKDKNLATVTGVKSSITAMTSTATGSVANMKAADLNNAVTVDGGGVISFSFESDFKGTAARNNSITGSAKDDTITVAGAHIAINPGKGNDHIDLGNGTGNSVIYASGDGNDVITGFNANDKINITKGAFTVGTNGTNAVITVDKKSTITLNDYAGIVNVGGKTYDPSTGDIVTSTDLLLDDNYSMNAATDELSSIIKADTGSYTPYQFNDSLKLTKEESFIPQIAYASNKK